MTDDDEPFEGDPNAEAEFPIDGVLDLHHFAPADTPFLIQDYLDECQRRGVLEIRIIHGRGKGTLRRTVEAALKKRTDVLESHLAPRERGGWGATLVTLRRDDKLAAEGPTRMGSAEHPEAPEPET